MEFGGPRERQNEQRQRLYDQMQQQQQQQMLQHQQPQQQQPLQQPQQQQPLQPQQQQPLQGHPQQQQQQQAYFQETPIQRLRRLLRASQENNRMLSLELRQKNYYIRQLERLLDERDQDREPRKRTERGNRERSNDRGYRRPF